MRRPRGHRSGPRREVRIQARQGVIEFVRGDESLAQGRVQAVEGRGDEALVQLRQIKSRTGW